MGQARVWRKVLQTDRVRAVQMRTTRSARFSGTYLRWHIDAACAPGFAKLYVTPGKSERMIIRHGHYELRKRPNAQLSAAPLATSTDRHERWHATTPHDRAQLRGRASGVRCKAMLGRC